MTNAEIAVILVVVIIAAAVVAWYFLQQQRTRKLRAQFGPEYDRVRDIEVVGDRNLT